MGSQRSREIRIILESEGLCKSVFTGAVAYMVYQQGMRDFILVVKPSVCVSEPFPVRRLQLTIAQGDTIFNRLYL